jgi:hypothetical protein
VPIELAMSRDRPDQEHRTSGAGPGASTHAAPAPGRQTRTAALPARTGVPAIDDGPLCEREANADHDCTLTREQRRDLIRYIGERANIIGDNARDALQDTRIEVLLDEPHGWGPLAEFLFYATTGPIIGTIMKGVKASKYARFADDIQATMVNVSRAQRKVLQGMAGTAPGKESKARFLALVRDAIGPWRMALTEEAPVGMDDGALIGLKDALDPRVMTVSHFTARIADMLARFDKQQIDQAGVETHYKHGELIWVTHGRTRRLIMMEAQGLHHTVDASSDIKPRDLIQKVDDDGKPIVIDRDLESAAVAFYTSRTGRAPFEMDAEAAIAKGGEIGKLASGMLIDGLAGLGSVL